MTEVTQTPPPEPKIHRNHRKLWILTIVFLVIALVWFCYWLFYAQYHKYTDDAYANGSMININAAVPGSVISFFADDTDLVKEGQLLVLLDSTSYQVAYDRALASLAASVLQVRKLFDNVTARAAAVESRRTMVSKAQYDYDNRQSLIDIKAVSQEDYTHAKDELTIAEQQLAESKAELEAAQAAAGSTSPENHPLIEEQKGNVRTAYYNLKHCSIYAPATGFIAQRSVDVGEWAAPLTNLMAVIPKDYVWVDANYKETQLTYMRIGQPASVTFDLYGSHVKFKGKVLGIASGTGSVFSIIPPQNATGNWIKIVQRLPVRISLDPEMVEKYPIRLGISAEVSVDITDQNLPRLAPVTNKRPVGTTTVFDLDLAVVNQVIDLVIKENMKPWPMKQEESYSFSTLP